MVVPLISIIDDDEDVQIALADLMRSFGYSASRHGSASAFLSSAELAQASCIVTDVSMPGLDGVGLKRALDAGGIPTPVIMITAHFEPHVRARALACRPFRLLTKPFPGSELVEAVESALRRSRTARE